ncbi:MAG: hypothetical protein K8R59_02660, partial [Thermoanaerobaculales bacterium]|nr:hypothetical protein [Thermoanaerobaculales bacterium]
MMGRLRIGLVLMVGLFLILSSVTAFSGETNWWVLDSATDLLKGEGDGVAVSSAGRLQAVAQWRMTAALDEPVALAADRLPGGDLVVVTGHPARLYRLRGEALELLADLPGEQGTAVMVDAEGTIWVTTVAPGVLLRWKRGELEEVGRLGEGGFWALAEFSGTVVAAAGPPGSLYRVGERGLERWLELPDDFIRSMVVANGSLVVGTSGRGLVISIDVEGRPALLVDSAFTEISALAVDGAGDLWATALVGEPAAAPTRKKDTNGAPKKGDGPQEQATGTLDLDLPKIEGKTATSELVRITPEGGLLHVHRFPKQVAAALAIDGDGVLVGTGYEGEVWRFLPEGGARVASIDAVQVTAFARDGRALLTQGPAAVFLPRRSHEQTSRFRSPAKTFSLPVLFGRFRVLPEDSGAGIRFRTGGISKSNPLWLPWTASVDASSGRVDVPHGRVLQWELELPAGAQVDRVEVAWREINLPPVVDHVNVEAPGVIYLSGPPPVGPVIRRDHPTFEGVFTTFGENRRNSTAAKKGKKYYQVGFRTVNWSAKDPNGDPLLFDLDLERADGLRLPIRRRFEGEQVAVDVTAAPDGRYRFHLSASDAQANPSAALTAEGSSSWFVVDSTSPEIVVHENGDAWAIVVQDNSALAKVEASWDGER